MTVFMMTVNIVTVLNLSDCYHSFLHTKSPHRKASKVVFSTLIDQYLAGGLVDGVCEMLVLVGLVVPVLNLSHCFYSCSHTKSPDIKLSKAVLLTLID